jgi:hypothetical protein
MVYKKQIQNLLESLDAKIRLIDNVSKGVMRMESNDVNQLIDQTKKIVEQISNLISIERD